MKRLISIVLCACLIFTLTPAAAFGAAAEPNYTGMKAAPNQYYIAAGTVRTGGAGRLDVMKSPSQSASVCKTLREGTAVYILKKEAAAGWHKIYCDGYIAYVKSENIANVKKITSNSQRVNLGFGVPVKFAGGTGTSSKPYIVKTPAQLNSIRFGMDKYYKLGKDIDLSKWGQWLPIGDNIWYNGRSRGIASGRDAKCFTGQLNGNGHLIKGMTVSINRKTPAQPEPERQDERHFGLFAITSSKKASNPVIKNLGLVNHNIDVNYSAIDCQLWIWAGAFTSSAGHCSFYKCWTKNGKVRITVNTGAKKKYGDENVSNLQIGGLTGSAYEVRFTSCANTGSVTMRTDRMKGYTKAIGGITSIGTLCRIDKCFNSGKITLPQTSHNNTSAGGIMAGLSNPHDGGNGDKGHLFDTYNTGKVTGGHFAGGLVGYTDIGIRLNRCYAIGKVSNAKYRGTLYPKSVTRVKYAKSCYKNGKSVSGKAWKNSASLKRKVLKSIPETNIPSSKK